MLNQVKELPSRAAQILKKRDGTGDARPVLKSVERSLRNEWRDALDYTTGAPSLDREQTEALHVAIENLTACHTEIKRMTSSRVPVVPHHAADVIATQLANTKRLIGNHAAANGRPANIVAKTQNLIFAAAQELHSAFGLTNQTTMMLPTKSAKPSSITPVKSVKRTMELSAAMMYELRQSLFPAERMIVGAGRRNGDRVNVEALFDVTGEASAGGVKAHPDRLGRALIAMSQTGTHFAIWIHSHPGRGPNVTHPSRIDIRQHADWIRDYSPDLVSAIMVEDRYLRFWGTAVETGAVAVSIFGDGVSLVSPTEHIYRLEV